MSAACFPARHALIPQRRYRHHAAFVPCLIPLRRALYATPARPEYISAPRSMSIMHCRHAYPFGFRCDPQPLPIPPRHRHHAYPASTGCRPAVSRMQTRRLTHADAMRTGFHPDACSFVRRYLRGPAYVSYRRSASYSTAGEWLRPFEPRKTQRRERQ